MPGILEQLLPILAGRSLAAMNSPELQDIMQGRTPTFVPASDVPLGPSTVSAPIVPPTLTAPPPETGLGTQYALEQLQQALNAPGYTPPPEPKIGVGGRLLDALPQALAVLATGLNPAAGQAALSSIGGMRQQSQFEKESRQQQEQSAFEKRRQGQIAAAQAGLGVAEKTEAENRAEDREFRRYEARNREILGDQTFQANQAELARIWQDKRDQERADSEAKRQAAIEERQVKIRTGELAGKYRQAGAGAYSRELAERDMGLRDTVSAGADKWISAHARLEEARANKAAGLGGGKGGEQLQAVLEGGMRVPASLVDRRIGGVMINGKPVNVIGYTGKGTAQAPQAQQGETIPGPYNPAEHPTAQPSATAPRQAPVGKTVTSQQIQDAARKAGITYGKAAQQFTDAGYTIKL